MDLLDELKGLEVNVEEALNRFMNNVQLYERMLGKLNATVKDMEVLEFIGRGDLETAVANAHTLKGVMGNLSITPLYQGYTQIVALLRANNPEEAKRVLEGILPIQQEILACIQRHQ